MSTLPDWLNEQLALAQLNEPSDVDAALRQLKRRAQILDWFQIGYFVVTFVAILVLVFVLTGVSRRADRVARSQNAIERLADDFARLQVSNDPAERQRLLEELERDRQALATATTTTTTVVPSFGPVPTSSTTTTTTRAANPRPTSAAPTTTTTTAPPPSTTSTTTPPTPTTTCTSVSIVALCH